jgi:circadian clock protein KaiB
MMDNKDERKKTDGERAAVTDKMILQLYVSGMSAKSMEAIENIKRFCSDYLQDAYELDIIDLYKNPGAASEHQIVFSPSLVKKQPLPKKILIGTFEDTQKIIKSLGIKISG